MSHSAIRHHASIINLIALIVLFALGPFAAASEKASSGITEDEAYEIGIEAYLYFYPLVTMDVTRRVMTNVPAGEELGRGPMNRFHHLREFPPADFRIVVRPNFDTLYSSAWLDLTNGPVVVSAPDTNGRYYLLPMYDMWTDAFASPGKRTSGTSAQKWAVVPKGWTGELPEGVGRIDAPTPYVWVIGRTQTNGPKDYKAVNKVQDGFTITVLSQLGKRAEPSKFVADPSVDMETPPLLQVDGMPASKYFTYASELMTIHPPHITDWSQIARLKPIGIVPGKPFDYDNAPAEVRAGLDRAVPDALKLMRDAAQMKEGAPELVSVRNGWLMSVNATGVFGNFYLKRAVVTQVGLGTNQPEDAIYPVLIRDADNQPVVGGNNYVLHFEKEEIPPVNAFWSLTLYDVQGFQVANPLNRFAIGDRDALKYNADGSLDIYIQHKSPGADKEANWLPSPSADEVSLQLRLYAPKAEALDGRWNPPVVRKAD